MSEERGSVAGSSFPVLSVSGIVFIVLKLTDVIDWSWWWVLAPFWAPVALILVIFGVALTLKWVSEE